MPIEWIYRDTVPVEAFATSLLMTGAALPNDVSPPPPPPAPPSFANLVMLGSAEPRCSIVTNFSLHITNLTVLGAAEPIIQQNAN